MTQEQIKRLLDSRYPIHKKADPKNGIKKDCPLQRRMKELARQAMAERIQKDADNGLSFEEIQVKYAHQGAIHT